MRVFRLTLMTKVWVNIRSAFAKHSRIIGAMGVIAGIVLALAMAVPVYAGVSNLYASQDLSMVDLYELTSLGCFLWLFMSMIVINTDIFMAHTMDLGQRTKDVEFLQLLPMSFRHFYFIKVIERALTDLFSIALVLPTTIAVAAGAAGPLLGIPLGLIVFSLSLLSISAFLVAFQFTLTRFFPLSALKSIVNWLSLFSMFLYFGVPIVVIDCNLLDKVPTDFLKHSLFQFLPPTWFAGTLTYSSRDPMRAAFYLFGASLFTLLSLHIWYLCTAHFRRIGWSYSAAHKKNGEFKGWSRWFKGYAWKELLMLRRDKNILVNGVCLPLAITAIVLHNWSTIGWVKGANLSSVLSIVSGGLLYFHLFGAINSVGTEGKAIGLLSMIPLTPFRFLALKTAIWGFLGIALFCPFFLIYLYYSAPIFPPITSVLLSCLWLFFLSMLLATLGVALSVHFVNYEAKFLQQASTIPGKIVMLLFSARAVYALNMKELIPAIKSVVFLCLLAAVLFYKAVHQLEHPHDDNLPPKAPCPLADSLLVLFIMGLAGPAITMAINAIVYENAGFAKATLITLAIVDVAGITATLFIFAKKHRRLFETLGFNFSLAYIAAGALGGIIFGYLGRGYQTVMPRLGIPTSNSTMAQEHAYLYIGTICILVPLCEEILFRGFIHRGLQQVLGVGRRAILTSAFFFAMLHPYPSMPPVYLIGIALAVLYDKSKSLTACVVFHILYNVIVSLPFIHPALYY